VKVLHCVVNYRTDDALVEYLQSILAACAKAGSAVSVSILIVDNSTRPADRQASFAERIAQQAGARAEVAFAERNLGYFGALPIAQARAAVLLPDALVFSNADLRLAEDFFVQLAGSLPTRAAVIAPAIITDHGEGFDQNPKLLTRYTARKLSFLRVMYSTAVTYRAYTVLGWLKERMRRRGDGRPTGTATPTTQNIYAAHGALFIFSKLRFVLGLPRYEPFLYGEELFVAEEGRKASEVTVYNPAIRVLDGRHASTHSLGFATRRHLFKESVDFILKRYY
jgi:GT2 family glycosyltransferase